MNKYNYPAHWQKHVGRLGSMAQCEGHINQWMLIGGMGVVDHSEGSMCVSGLRNDKKRIVPEVLAIKLYRKWYGRNRVVIPLARHSTQDYLKWLFSDSPLAELYVTNSVEEVRGVGVCLIRCDIPANLMLIATQAFRYIWEFPLIIEAWGELVKLGVDRSHALILAQWCGKVRGQVEWGGGCENSNHAIFGERCRIDTLSAFKHGEWVVVEELYSVCGAYKGVQHTWTNFGQSPTVLGAIDTHLVKTKVDAPFGASLNLVYNPYKQIANALKLVLGE